MLNSTNFSYLFNYFPILQSGLQSFLCSQVRFFLFGNHIKETLLIFGCSVFVLYTSYFSDVNQTGICASVRKWMKNQPLSLWQASIKREEKTEEKNSGSNFNTVCDVKDYLLLLNAYRKSVLKMLWKIITGEHTTNTKGLRDHESTLLNEGTGKERCCWSTTYGNMEQLALHNSLWHDETKKTLSTQILKNKGML